MILLIDNFDSFTFNLVDYLEQLEQEVLVVRNDISLREVIELKFDRMVVSPGPETPSKAGNLMPILKWAVDNVPVLGVCLGHQAIGELYGACLRKSMEATHGKLRKVRHENHRIFNNIPSTFNVIRYNSLVIDEQSKVLDYIAFDENNEVMAIAHKDLPVVGIQYHPESILTEFGLEVIKNWLSF